MTLFTEVPYVAVLRGSIRLPDVPNEPPDFPLKDQLQRRCSVCFQAPVRRPLNCSKCKTIFYCNTGCQPYVSVLRGFSRLPSIPNEPPDFPLKDQLLRRCTTCFKVVERPMNCSQCKTVHYCSKKCQVADWKLHKYECKPLKRAIVTGSVGASQDDYARLLGRLVIKSLHVENANPDSQGDGVQDWNGVRAFGLDDLTPRLHPDPTYHTEVDKGADILWRAARTRFRAIYEYTPIAAISDEVLEKLFAKIRLYSIPIVDYHPEYGATEIGKGLYLNLARFPQSCDPDLACSFASGGTTLHYKKIKKISATKAIDSMTVDWTHLRGDADLYAYHAFVLHFDRSEFLKWECYITCECHVCKDDEQEANYRSSTQMSCPDCGEEDEGTLTVSKIKDTQVLKCFLCDKVINDFKTVNCVTQTINKCASRIEESLHSVTEESAIQSYLGEIENAGRLLHPSQNVTLMQMYEDAFQIGQSQLSFYARDRATLGCPLSDKDTAAELKSAQLVVKYGELLNPLYDNILNAEHSDWLAVFYWRMANAYRIHETEAGRKAQVRYLKKARKAWMTRFGEQFKCAKAIEGMVAKLEAQIKAEE